MVEPCIVCGQPALRSDHHYPAERGAKRCRYEVRCACRSSGEQPTPSSAWRRYRESAKAAA